MVQPSVKSGYTARRRGFAKIRPQAHQRRDEAPARTIRAGRVPSPGRTCQSCGATVKAGGFQIEKVIQKNDRGRVYLARDAQGGKVALKELAFATIPSAELVEAFEREGLVLQELHDPHIPRFVASFRQGEGVQTRLYLAQEFVDGESLAEALLRRRFDEAEVLEVMAQVLRVLRYLHGQNPRLLHRDVKPANLLRRTDGSIALVDFGSVRETLHDRTHRSTLVGTFGYAPIEQLGGTVDASSDLYALGATALHLLSGRPPDQMYGPDFGL